MRRILCWSAVAVLLAGAPVRAAEMYMIKEAKTPVPEELKEGIRAQLKESTVQLQDAKGNVLVEVWFRKQLPAKATPEQVKNGLSYQEVSETTLVGALRVVQQITDYRKQKIKPGVYTLRLGLQPMNGDHMGTAPHPEFCLLVPAKEEKGPEPLGSAKELQDLSTKASGTGHPAVFLLFPNDKPPEAPALVNKGDGHWALSWKEDVSVGDTKAGLGFALTLIGHSAAE